MDNMFLATMKLGFREQHIGTKMLRTAAEFAADRAATQRLYMTKEVYPYVARQYGVSVVNAERNMRYAVQKSNQGYMTVGECVCMLAEVRRGLR